MNGPSQKVNASQAIRELLTENHRITAGQADGPRTDGLAAARRSFNLEDFRKFIDPLNTILFTATGLFFAFLLAVCFLPHERRGILNLLIVAIGALGGGGLLGFIYGSYGSDVTTRFGPVFTLLGGLLTGATITDLSKPDSGISEALNSLANSCGLTDSGGLMVAVIISFASLGFLLMYLNLGLILSLPTAIIADIGKDTSKAEVMMIREIVKTNVSISDAERRRGLTRPDELTASAAAVLAGSPGAGETGSALKLLDDARAFSAIGKLDMVEKALRNALKQKPNDTTIKYELANHLLFSINGRETESIPYFEEVVQSSDTPANAWKYLGFAYLWDPKRVTKAIDALNNYLKLFPHDNEAKLSLAGAHAQTRSPQNPTEKEELLDEVAALINADPSMKQRISEQEADGNEDDFKLWRKDGDFMKLLRT